ncbi:MAG: hypothetical protein V3V00_10820, partial [Saprospiraceae bacterium]
IVGPFHKIGIFILRPICHNPLILRFHAWLSEIKKVAFVELYIFLNSLILRHYRISKNVNIIQTNSFYEKC